MKKLSIHLSLLCLLALLLVPFAVAVALMIAFTVGRYQVG